MHTLTQNDVSYSTTAPPQRLPPIMLHKASNRVEQQPLSNDIQMKEIRRQNDVETWRNKIRLQEKFEVNINFMFLKKTTL